MSIGHAVAGPAEYASVTVAAMEVTVADDEEQSVLADPESIEVTENGTATFTVVLGSEPVGGTVTVTPTVSGDAAVTVTPASRSFNAASWETPKVFTVTAAEDGNAASEAGTVSFSAAGADYADARIPNDVAVTVTDDDVASTRVRLTVSPVAFDEDAGATVVTVTGTLNGATRSVDTVATLVTPIGTAFPEDDYTLETPDPFTLTIDAGETSGTQTFTVTPVDDDIDEDDETFRVEGTRTGLAISYTHRVTLTIRDNDTRGLVLSRTALAVTEDDATGAGYTVALATEPTGSVTVTVDVPSGTDVLVSPATLTFDDTNWSDPQTVTVTADFDDDAVADPPVTIAHSVAGADYEGVAVDDTVTVTIAEADTAAIWVEKTAVALDEGATATWKVALDTEPSGTVTVTPEIPVGADAVVTPASVTFTPGSYESPKTFTLTAEHDDDAVDDAAFTVGHGATGGDYEGLSGPGVEVTVTDDDEPGLAVTPDPLAVPEGGSAAFMVRLLTEPSTTVTVVPGRKAPHDPDVTLATGSLTFNAGNWDDEQEVRVEGAEDADADDDEQVITFDPSGGEYAGADTVEATARVEDGDKASSEVRLSVAPAGGAEDTGGAAVTVTAALDAAPRLEDTTVTVSVGAGTGADAASASDFEAVSDFVVTILAGQAEGTADFTLAPVDDDYEGDETLSVSGSTSAAGFTVAGTEVSILEDDVRCIALSTTAVTVVEAAVGETYGVRLATRPGGAVTVLAEVPGGTDVRVSPAAGLVFGRTNWNTEQFFTVSAVDDADSTPDAVVSVTHRVAGADYETVAVDAAVAVTITENDTPGVGISANLFLTPAIRIVGRCAMRGGSADGRGVGSGVVVSARGLAGTGTGDRGLEGSAQGQVGRRPAAHAVAASGLRTLAARDRGPCQEGEPGRSVRRGLVEAAEEVGGLASRVVRRAVSRTGDGDVGRWRVPGQGVRRDDGEGAGPDRGAVAPALQRAPSVAGVRLLQAHGERGTGHGRGVCAVPGRRGRLCARRPGLLDCCGPPPRGVRGGSCHRAREHRGAVASRARRRDFRFMLNQVVRAIEPHLSLAEVIDEWNQISKSLSEPPRRRLPQIAECFVEERQTS